MNNLVKQLWLLQQIYSNTSDYDPALGCSKYRIPKEIPQDDLEMLRRAGRLPNHHITFSHAEVIRELKELAGSWTQEAAAGAFIASLWSTPFMWRATLPGKLLGQAMPDHEFEPYSAGSSSICRVCGFRQDACVDETLHWYFAMIGEEPIDGLPTEYVSVLRSLKKRGAAPTPKTYDLWAFRAILTVLRGLPKKTSYMKAAEALAKERLLPTREIWAYRSLLESLALIGVLATEEHPGMAEKFTSYTERDQRPDMNVEVQAPLAWWKASCGLRQPVLERLFGQYDLSLVDLQAARPEAIPHYEETITGSLQKASEPKDQTLDLPATAGKGPVEAGDVYAVRINDSAWVTLYCHEVEDFGNRKVVRTEFLKGVYKKIPEEDQLQLQVQGRPTGRWQHWTSALDATKWIHRITRKVSEPQAEAKVPSDDRIPRGPARELPFLALHCFGELN